jgi:hypothetical protein
MRRLTRLRGRRRSGMLFLKLVLLVRLRDGALERRVFSLLLRREFTSPRPRKLELHMRLCSV